MDQGIIAISRIMEELGEGSSRLSIVASASLAVLCLFYIYTVGAYFQVQTYPLINRVTYYTPFHSYIVNEHVDHTVIGSLLILWLASTQRSKKSYFAVGSIAAIFALVMIGNYNQIRTDIALFSLPAIIVLLVYNHYSQKQDHNSRRLLRLTINYLAVIAVIVGIISLVASISNIVSPIDTDSLRHSKGTAYDIFLLLSSFSPIILLLLIACVPVKLLIDFIKSKIPKAGFQSGSLRSNMSTQMRITFLLASIILSILMAIIPHLVTVNVDNQLVGVDTIHYADWMKELASSSNAQDFIQQIFVKQSNGDRPISLLLIFAFQQTFSNIRDPSHTIEYLPLIIGPMLVVAIYLLTRKLVIDESTSLFAAFLTAISFQTLIGIYAGFYANWIALIFGYLSFLFFFRYLETQRTKDLVVYGTLLILTLFSHLYTWSIFALVTGIFLSIVLIKPGLLRNDNYLAGTFSQIRRRPIILLFAVLFCTVVVDVGRMVFTGSSGGIERDLQVSERAGSEQFALRWNNLTYATTAYVGGLFANFIIFGLGLYWLITSNIKEKQNIFMIVFLSIGILPFLFGEWVIQTRVFYDIPFEIPAALALLHMKRKTSSFTALKILPICIWLMAVSIIAVSNFHLAMPPK